jgi:hypothetical protein
MAAISVDTLDEHEKIYTQRDLDTIVKKTWTDSRKFYLAQNNIASIWQIACDLSGDGAKSALEKIKSHYDSLIGLSEKYNIPLDNVHKTYEQVENILKNKLKEDLE